MSNPEQFNKAEEFPETHEELEQESRPDQFKQPHFISSRLLEALGGKKTQTAVGEIIERGAFLWGMEGERDERGKGILNHVLLASRVAYVLAESLKEKNIAGYKDVNPQYIVEAVLLHDTTKLFGEERENLPPEVKKALGLREDYGEYSAESDDIGSSWLKELGFSPEVYEAIRTDKGPEDKIYSPYYKIVKLADYMAGQKVTTVDERLADIKKRWIDDRLNRGEKPRVSSEKFEEDKRTVKGIADEIFGLLNTNEKELIKKHQLNSNASQTRWEKFLRKTYDKKQEARAKHLVERHIK